MTEVDPGYLASSTVLDIVDVGLVACDSHGRLTLFNRASRVFHGLDADASIDPACFSETFDLYDTDGLLLAPHDVPLLRALREGSVDEVDIVIAPHDLPARTVSCSGRQLTGADGFVLGAVVWMRDVTEQQESLRLLADSERMFRTAFIDSPLGFAIADDSGRLADVNPALCRLLGHSPGWLLQHGLADARTGASALLERRDDSAPDSVQERHLATADGSGVWVRIVRSAVSRPGGLSSTLLQIEDITQRRLADQELRTAATRDPLTGLANRAGFAERTKTALSAVEGCTTELALMFVDLDNFKHVNDTYGHELGDAMLAEVGRRLVAALRGTDTVARLGGDEFALLCVGLDPTNHDEGHLVAERVVATLGRPYRIGELEITMSASVGVAFAHDDRTSGATLLAHADAAMYAAKRAGKGRLAAHHASQSSSGIRVAGRTEQLLRRALDTGRVVVHYQPVVDLQTGLVIGVEALCRVPDDQGGMLSPAEFIPVAERTGLIVPLGMAVLEQSVLRTVTWKSVLPHDREFGLGVNLSVRQLVDPLLVSRVQRILASSGIAPDALVFELTESVFSDSDDHAMVLRRLNDLGPRVIIDDFGTGFSSLSYLRRFPVNGIKIDRSFVTDLPHDARDRTVTRALVSLGRDLEVPVIAEGIETAEQLTQLRALGCPLGQGYLLSRPVPAEEIRALLDQPLPVLLADLPIG